MSPRARSYRVALAFAVAWIGAVHPLGAQVAPQPAPTVPAQPAPLGVSPRGALIRAMVLPGWGHAAIGSYSRGGFYVAIESLTAYTLIRTRNRLSDVRDRVSLRESFLRESLAAEGVTDPALIATELEEDGFLRGLDALAASRENQQEDLVAFGLFLLFLSGADAFVSAHLARFPTPIEVQAAPAPDGGVELGFRLPIR